MTTIRIRTGERVLTATLYDNPAAQELLTLLPLTLTLQDYAGTEKVSDLPRRLSSRLPAT